MQIDIDLIKVVVEDLNYLNFEWDQEISDTSLRMSNVLLRKLLVDGYYAKAWQMVGFEKQPYIENYEIDMRTHGDVPYLTYFKNNLP